MALNQHVLLDLVGELKLTDTTDRIRSATERLYQELIDAEATAFIGAAPFERTETRTTQRNGTRPKTVSTTAGDLELKIPKLRSGIVLPVAAGAATPGRSGAVRSGDGGLPARGVDPQGRRPRPRARR